MIIYNFNNTKYGKTIYETNKKWKNLKKRIKEILDNENSCKEIKILEIEALLEDFKNRYLKEGKK